MFQILTLLRFYKIRESVTSATRFVDYKNGCSCVVGRFIANVESLNLFNSRGDDQKKCLIKPFLFHVYIFINVVKLAVHALYMKCFSIYT